MPARRRLPFAVIGGFLGAGKTTLLNRLLRGNAERAVPRRIAVLVNDFGAINIDASLIERASSNTIALSNGCVCCQIGDELSAALVGVLDTEPPFDALVVEASGVSDPWKIAQIARADPAFDPEATVVLVDAAAVVAQAADPLLADTLVRQLAHADTIVLNKVDLADAASLTRVRAWLREHAGDVEVFETVGAELPMPIFAADWPSVTRERIAADGDPGDEESRRVVDWEGRAIGSDRARDADRFDSSVLHDDRTFCVARMRAALQSMPAGVLRLKGIVRSDEHGWSELQFAGRNGLVRKAPAAPDDRRGVLVAIGLRGRLPSAELAAWISGSLAPSASGAATQTPDAAA